MEKEIEIKIKNEYPQLFKNAKTNEEKQKLFEQIINEENLYRKLFAKERETSKEIQDPHLMLVDTYKNLDIYEFTQETEEEKKIPKLFLQDQTISNKKCINSFDEFKRNFEVFTEGQFRFLNWKNCFVAGGSILASLMPIPDKFDESNLTRRNYFHDEAYSNSDVDIFLYGINDPEEANEKLKEIFKTISETIPFKAIAFRSRHAVTIVSQYPYRHIQIILRLYKSISEILMGFDVDSCSCGFDGEKVWMTPRCHNSLIHRYNTIDMTRRSPTYETRLAKYGSRGFSVLVPFLDRSKIDISLYERRIDRVHGLAKLLLLEQLQTSRQHTIFKEFSRLRRLRPPSDVHPSVWGYLHPSLKEDKKYVDSQENESDYSVVFLPWGKEWNAEAIQKVMYRKDMVLNSSWYDPDRKFHTHPCFFGTAEEIIGDCCGAENCSNINLDEELGPSHMYVNGDISWMTVDPGQQSIGSFHPITDEDWCKDAYIPENFDLLFQSISEKNHEKLHQLLTADSSNINKKDYVGRAPIHLAVLYNSIECVKVLIDFGAKLSFKMIDGRSPIHLAAQYGYSDILEIILDKLNEIKNQNNENINIEDEKEKEDYQQFSLKKLIEMRIKKTDSQLFGFDPSLEVVDEKFDVNQEDWDLRMTPLHYAIFFGNIKCIDLLIDKGGADIDKMLNYKQDQRIVSQYFPLSFALLGKQYEVAQHLLERNVDLLQKDLQGQNILHKICARVDLKFLKIVMDFAKKNQIELEWVSRNFTTPLDSLMSQLPENPLKHIKVPLAIKETKDEIIKSLDLTNSENQFNKHYEMVLFLIKESPLKTQLRIEDVPKHLFRPNENKETVLRNRSSLPLISCNGSFHLIKFFIENGADINAFSSSAETILDRVQIKIKEVQESIDENTKSIRQLPLLKKEIIMKKLSKMEPKSFIYNELESYCKNLEIEAEQFSFYSFPDYSLSFENDNLIEDEKKPLIKNFAFNALQREQTRLELLKEIEEYLKSKNAKNFVDIELNPDSVDSYLITQQTNMKNPSSWEYRRRYVSYTSSYRTEFDNISRVLENETSIDKQFPVRFFSLSESIFGHYINSSCYVDNLQPMYLELFEAVSKGDIETVENLTIKKPIGEQLQIASYVEYSRRTPLHIAVENNHPQMLRKLIEILTLQFTPLQNEAETTKYLPMINNQDLIRMKKHMKPRYHVDQLGQKKYQPVDELRNIEQEMKELNCVISPSTTITSSSALHMNVLDLAIEKNNFECCEIILESCQKLDKSGNQVSYEKTLLQHAQHTITYKILFQVYKFIPFEHAIQKGNIKVAQKLLEFGGVYSKETKNPKTYKGLNIDGKKHRWHQEHYEHEYVRSKNALFIASYFNQPESIEYLVDEAKKQWKNLFSEKLETHQFPESLSLEPQENWEYSAMHYAVSNKSLKAIEAIVKHDEFDLLNAPLKNGLTPLMMASILGDHEVVDLLLKLGAKVELTDPSGWTALHYCCGFNSHECIKVFMKHLSKEQLNIPTKYFAHSPLMISAFGKNVESVDVLLSDPRFNIFEQDNFGNTALHYAVIQSHLEIIKKLLPEKIENPQAYLKENTVGMTVLDYAVMAMSNLFQYRIFRYNRPLLEQKLENECFEYVAKVLGLQRKIVHLFEAQKSFDEIANQFLVRKECAQSTFSRHIYFPTRISRLRF
ncbi:ankyrin repeat ph and sec7 domain containing protein secg-related [Anaeramoeba ignava]|uniref:Ankyrin repeat ph and sec7 domain containing protein secg-related n=1 Tax=Anaeramoeba ignava TaxID=1746090 RepID=A0A9Q0LT93_ANAIG|nr:ankyrin repeat ph and sec7 domain containing protein secg-related [Anaeramoeba ignava]